MAKRGRKKKSKVTSLSSADKGHLKRILGKVRQIKANKAAAAGPTTTLKPNPAVQTALNAAQANLQRFLTTSNPNNPQFNVVFAQLSKLVADLTAKLFQP